MMKLSGIYAAAMMALSFAGLGMGASMLNSTDADATIAEVTGGSRRIGKRRRKVKRWKQPMRQHGRKSRHK